MEPSQEANSDSGDFEFGNFEEGPAAAMTVSDAAEEEVVSNGPDTDVTNHGKGSSASDGDDQEEEDQEAEMSGRKPPSSKAQKDDTSGVVEETQTPKEEEQEQEKSTQEEEEQKQVETNEPEKKEKKQVENNQQQEAAAVDDHSQVEAEVCEAFFEWTAAWNAGNLFGYLDAYWESEETRYISAGLANGTHAKGNVVITGRRDIDKVFTEIFVKNKKQQEKQKAKKGVAGTLTLRKLIVTPAGSENAVVYGEHQLEVAGDKKGQPRGGVFTIHCRKVKGQWKIISEHATELPKK